MNPKKCLKRACFALTLLFAAAALGGCAQKTEERLSSVGFYFDTVITLTIYDSTQKTLDDALALCGEYENLLSKTIEGSDVWRINHANGQPTQVDKRTARLLKRAQEISAVSGGAFDVTIAPASSLWHFTDGSAVLPDAEKLKEAAALVDYTQLVLEGNTVTLPKGRMIDLGGIAKGFIADELTAYFKSKGVKHGLINLGGNVVVIGDKPGGAAWTVGIQDPKQATGAYIGAVSATDSSVVTSGIYERGFELDGKWYHHLLDPKTGWPADNELASISILSKSSMDGDALSTACFVLGLEKSKEMLQKLDGIEAIFVTRDEQVICTDGAKDILKLAPQS